MLVVVGLLVVAVLGFTLDRWMQLAKVAPAPPHWPRLDIDHDADTQLTAGLHQSVSKTLVTRVLSSVSGGLLRILSLILYYLIKC